MSEVLPALPNIDVHTSNFSLEKVRPVILRQSAVKYGKMTQLVQGQENMGSNGLDDHQ